MPNFNPVTGTHDIIGEEADAMRSITSLLSACAELYGYAELIPPVLEYTEVFARGTGAGSDIVRKEMYTFLDKGERSVTMRPEFTAGIVRSIVSNKLYANDLPLKYYYAGPSFRYERPQLGRYRQFNQFGVEMIGENSALADAECILMAAQSLYMLGFDKVKIKINSLGDEASRLAYRKALVDYFSQYIDELCDDCKERIKLNPLRMLDCKVEHDRDLGKGAPKIKDYLSEQSEKRFYETLSILNDMEIDYEIDEELVRGLDYYSEVVFEIHAESAEGKDYGALCGGGHYDGLVAALGGPDLPGVGYAMGLERVLSVLRDNGKLPEDALRDDLFIIPIGEETMESAFVLATECRALGYRTELPYKTGKVASLFKKADRKKARFALVLGSDELAEGKAQLKDLTSGEQHPIDLNNLEQELDNAFAPYEEEDECDHHHHEEEGE